MKPSLALAAAALLAAPTAGPRDAEPAVAPEARDPARWAVIVGINDYAAFDGVSDGDLRGAVNDARSMYEVLTQRWGFPEENVRLLLDADATRAGIEAAVTEWMAANVKPGDVALFFYAGHGSQTIDTQGDEPDGLDETIAPQDVSRGVSDKDVTDDELREWFSGLDTDEVIVIFDSCHSGTATRALSPRARPRSLPRDVPRTAGTRGGGPQERGMATGSVRFELAAAAPDQVAMDWIFPQERGQMEYPGGAFTTHLVRQLWRAEPGRPLKEAFDQAAEAMKADRFAQDPQFAGPEDAPVFGVAPGEVTVLDAGEVPVPPAPPELFVVLDDVAAAELRDEPLVQVPEIGAPDAPRPEASAERLEGAAPAPSGELLLAAGASFGVTPGSLYAMGDGIVRVVAVRERESVVVPVAGSPSYTGLARLVAYAPPAATITVNTDDVPADLLRDVAGRVDAARVTLGAGDDADLYLKAGAQEWELLSRGDALRATVPVSAADPAGALAEALRQELAAQRIATVDNPAPSFDVSVAFSGGAREFRVRDPIAFTVTSEEAGYLTLVDLGTDGTVTVLFPNRFVPGGRIEAGQTVEIPTAEMPFRLRASPPQGWGMVRVLVTPEPLPLPVTDEPLLSRKEGETLAQELVDALHAALAAQWSEPASLAGALPVTGWATGIVNYRVVP